MRVGRIELIALVVFDPLGQCFEDQGKIFRPGVAIEDGPDVLAAPNDPRVNPVADH